MDMEKREEMDMEQEAVNDGKEEGQQDKQILGMPAEQFESLRRHAENVADELRKHLRDTEQQVWNLEAMAAETFDISHRISVE